VTTFEHFKSTYDQRVNTYKGAVLSFALGRKEGQTRILRGTLVFTKHERQPDQILDYGKMLLERRYLSCKEALEFITSLENEKVPPGFVFDPLPMKFKRPSWLQSGDLITPVGFYRLSPWPAAEYLLCTGTSWGEPNGPLVSRDLPLVISPSLKIDEWIGATLRRHSMETGVAIVMPDYRARISRIRFEEAAVEVSVEADMAKPEDVVVKAAVDDNETEPKTENHSLIYRMGIEEIPSSFHFFVLDRLKDEVIDWAMVYLSWAELPPEIEFSLPGKQFAHLIAGGETQELEFKQEVGNGFTIIQSVVAFANTGGGTILVGVDDNAKIVGTDVDSDADKIREWIERRCDPPISVSFNKVILNDKAVLAVSVPRRSRSPCQHRENGVVYVRRGATDRPASLVELQGLFGSAGFHPGL
jgi:hypothetical protein